MLLHGLCFRLGRSATRRKQQDHRLGAAETRVALVQRSCGYADRPTLALAEIAQVVRVVRAASPRCLVLVDNCYGEFTEPGEPCSVS